MFNYLDKFVSEQQKRTVNDNQQQKKTGDNILSKYNTNT